MQTPAILNLSNAAPNAKAAKAPDNSAKDASFNQMLSRQMDERRAASNANQTQQSQKAANAEKPNLAKRSDNAAPQKSAGPAATDNAPKPAAKDAAKTAAGEQTNEPASATDLLALAAQGLKLQDAAAANQPAIEADTADAAEALSPAQIALAGANGAAIAINSARAEKDTSSTSTTRTDVVTDNTKGKSETFERALAAQDKPTGLANAAAAVQNAGAGKAAEKFSSILGESAVQDLPSNGTTSMAQQSAIDVAKSAGEQAVDRLAARVGTPAWNQALGQKVVWMANGAQQSASLILNPAELGPVQVVLNITNGQADASFYAVNPETRQALEAAMQKLREMMSEAGVELGQSTVSAGMPEQQNRSGEQGSRQAAGGLQGNDTGAPQTSGVTQVIHGGQGLVDTFA